MIVHEIMEQGSEEWFGARKGRPTASQFEEFITPSKGELSKSDRATKYMRKLARECVCEDPMEFMGNKYTDWGQDMEDEAAECFEQHMGEKLHKVGFCTRDDGVVGCSPDRLIKGESEAWRVGLEIKCPQVDTHVGYLLEGVLPAKYKLQVHGSMAVTSLDHWWFMSYFPGLNPLIIKVERDEFTEKVSTALDEFLLKYAAERERVLEAILPRKDAA